MVGHVHHQRLVTFLPGVEWLSAVRTVRHFLFCELVIDPAPDAFSMKQMVAGGAFRKKLILVLIVAKLLEANWTHLVSGALIDLVESQILQLAADYHLFFLLLPLFILPALLP